jgi:hypothetical protein
MYEYLSIKFIRKITGKIAAAFCAVCIFRLNLDNTNTRSVSAKNIGFTSYSSCWVPGLFPPVENTESVL